MSKFNTPQNEKNYETGTKYKVHIFNVNFHYAKFKYKGMETDGVTNYKN